MSRSPPIIKIGTLSKSYEPSAFFVVKSVKNNSNSINNVKLKFKVRNVI